MSQPDQENQENLEYNDGIGDLLRNKDTSKFSWIKTILTLVLFVIGVFVTLSYLFNYGKTMLVTSNTPPNTQSTQETTSFQEQYQSIEEENKTLINEIEQSIKTVSTTPLPTSTEISKEVTQVTKEIPKETRKEIIKETPKEKAVIKKTPKAIVKETKVATPFKVIAGSYESITNAKTQKQLLEKKGYAPFIKTTTQNGVTQYQVQVGAFKTHATATAFKSKLDHQNMPAFIQSN